MTFRASPMMWYVWGDLPKVPFPGSNSCSVCDRRGLTEWGLSLVALNCFTSILAVPKHSGMFVWTFALKPHSENQLMLTWARNPASLVNFCFQMKPCGVFSCDCFQVSFKELRAFYVLRYDIKLMPSHSLQSLLEFRTHFLSHSPFLLVNCMFLTTW